MAYSPHFFMNLLYFSQMKVTNLIGLKSSLKIMSKSISGIEEAQGTTQSTFHFHHHGSRTVPYLVSKQ